MYDFAETKSAHTAFWSLVRDHLRKARVRAPKNLSDTIAPMDVWADEDLVLSHICSLPYRKHFRHLTVIGASDYGLARCGPGEYRSLFIVRDDYSADLPEDLDGATMALNSDDSHSGWGAPATWAINRGMRFRPILWTGSHRHSLVAVVSGEVDFAAIDARSYEILKEIEPTARHVRVIGATDPSPGMTFVTREGQDPAPYLAALRHGIARVEDRHRRWLGLKDVIPLPVSAYDLPLPPDPRDWQP